MLLHQESGEGTRLPIVEHREVLLLQIVNTLSLLIADYDRHQHCIHIDVQGQPGVRLRRFWWNGAGVSVVAVTFFVLGSASTRANYSQGPKCCSKQFPVMGMAIRMGPPF